MGKLEGRAAIVTGAASGFGLATSESFALEGAAVVMVNRSAAKELGHGLDPVAADITKVVERSCAKDVRIFTLNTWGARTISNLRG